MRILSPYEFLHLIFHCIDGVVERESRFDHMDVADFILHEIYRKNKRPTYMIDVVPDRHEPGSASVKWVDLKPIKRIYISFTVEPKKEDSND